MSGTPIAFTPPTGSANQTEISPPFLPRERENERERPCLSHNNNHHHRNKQQQLLPPQRTTTTTTTIHHHNIQQTTTTTNNNRHRNKKQQPTQQTTTTTTTTTATPCRPLTHALHVSYDKRAAAQRIRADRLFRFGQFGLGRLDFLKAFSISMRVMRVIRDGRVMLLGLLGLLELLG